MYSPVVYEELETVPSVDNPPVVPLEVDPLSVPPVTEEPVLKAVLPTEVVADEGEDVVDGVSVFPGVEDNLDDGCSEELSVEEAGPIVTAGVVRAP